MLHRMVGKIKQRHSIVFRRVTGEEGSVSEDMVRDWKSHQLPSLLEEFSPDDIFNADETGLFWKCLPDKTLSRERSVQEVSEARIELQF